MSFVPGCAQVITIWNMPFLLPGKLIERATGAACHHCAMLLRGPDVWEAYMPVVRRMPWDRYREQLVRWAGDWRLRLTGQPLTTKIWQAPRATCDDMDRMESEAEAWLGKRYSMVVNYLRRGDGIHCSEFCGRVVQAAGLADWACEPSRITPIGLETGLQNAGWDVVEQLTFPR